MRFVKAIALFYYLCMPSFVSTAETPYQRPEEKIDRLIRAESFSNLVMNRQEDAMIKTFYKEMPSIKYVARTQVKLGGLRFNPQNYTSILNYYIHKISYNTY